MSNSRAKGLIWRSRRKIFRDRPIKTIKFSGHQVSGTKFEKDNPQIQTRNVTVRANSLDPVSRVVYTITVYET